MPDDLNINVCSITLTGDLRHPPFRFKNGWVFLNIGKTASPVNVIELSELLQVKSYLGWRTQAFPCSDLKSGSVFGVAVH